MTDSYQDPDVRLMLAVREDDAAAFEELLLRYQSRVQSVLRHLLGDADLADDLTQETFFRIYRARKSYEPGVKLAPWLFTIMNNVAFNALRNKSRRPEVQFGGVHSANSQDGESSQDHNFPEQNIPAGSSFLPARSLDRLEMREVVRLAVESLNENQRMAVLLHKFEGMSYQEISDAMKLSLPAVKSLLSRARTNLKEIITPYIERGTFNIPVMNHE